MAEILLSPGVAAIENDQSQLTQGPVTVGAAIIGPTVKGPVEVPTVVTSWSDYQSKFGSSFISGSEAYTYLTSIAANNYFTNGGETLLVARVVSGAFTAATSSNILNAIQTTAGIFATGSATFTGATALSEIRITGSNNILYRFVATQSGNPSDDPDGNLYFFASGSNISASLWNLKEKVNSISGFPVVASASLGLGNTIFALSGSFSGSYYNGYILSTGSATSFADQFVLGGGVDGIGSNAFVLETLSKGIIMNSTSTEDSSGALFSGSIDNIRWEIISANTSSGTFGLLIRQGNDNTNTPLTVESFSNLSLDPLAPNFITKVIGDQVQAYDSQTNQVLLTGDYINQSRLVRVKQVNSLTPNYYDNNGTAKAQYTASIPTNTSGTFGAALGTIGANAKFYDEIVTGAPNIQGLQGSDYNNMINLLSNQDDYRFNVLTAPGLTATNNATQVNTIISNTENRGDSIFVLDLVPYDVNSITSVTAAASAKNTSYAASYWPWVNVTDPNGVGNVWCPASTVIGGVYAKNDILAEPWFAPAGINRGILTVNRAKLKLSQTNRDSLYQGKVNPIATFPGRGVVVYGQKTLQTQASALDRVNVRRLLIALKSYISQVANNLVFEQNTLATRSSFLAAVNPYLDSVQQRQGLYAFQVVMDDSNNTAATIDQNMLIGGIYIQPTKTAEFVYLTFNITPTGATFPA
jgi:phage tail sheath protein FI